MSTLTYFFRVFPYDTPKTVKKNSDVHRGLETENWEEVVYKSMVFEKFY